MERTCKLYTDSSPGWEYFFSLINFIIKRHWTSLCLSRTCVFLAAFISSVTLKQERMWVTMLELPIMSKIFEYIILVFSLINISCFQLFQIVFGWFGYCYVRTWGKQSFTYSIFIWLFLKAIRLKRWKKFLTRSKIYTYSNS